MELMLAFCEEKNRGTLKPSWNDWKRFDNEYNTLSEPYPLIVPLLYEAKISGSSFDFSNLSFDKPVWVGEGLESEIDEDLYMVAEGTKLEMLSAEEFMKYEQGKLGWQEILAIFRKAGNTDQDIADAIVVELEKQNEGYKKQICDFEQKKLKNKMAEEVNVKICSLPGGDNSEKVMRYERSIQKSIFQNLLVLKKLQTLP